VKNSSKQWVPYERKTLAYIHEITCDASKEKFHVDILEYFEYTFNGNLHKAYYRNGLLHNKSKNEPAITIGKSEYWYKNGRKIIKKKETKTI
jgi:hypothetical protein